MLFASVNCTLSDTTNPSLTGISTQTVIVLSGQIVHEQSGPGSIPDSSFVVVDDAALKTLGLQKEQKVLFKISKNGTLIKSAEFTIKTDCCHVGKSAGPDKIPLN